jgi:hypothetical protein
MGKAANAADIRDFESEIENALADFCQTYTPPIEDLREEPQSVWNAALMFTRRKVFPDRKILKSKIIQSVNGSVNTNFNAYDYNIVNDILDIYIYVCMKYDKEISYIGFSVLTNIPDSVLRDWQQDGARLSPVSSAVSQKLIRFHEESLRNKQLKNDKIGATVLLNRDCGYNMPGVSRETRTRALSLEDIQRFSLGKSNTEQPPQYIDSENTETQYIESNRVD